MRKFKKGDIIKMDLENILKLTTWTPEWYSDKSFTIIKFIKKKNTGHIIAYLDNKLPNGEDRVWIEFIKLDIATMRKKKLEKLKNV